MNNNDIREAVPFTRCDNLAPRYKTVRSCYFRVAGAQGSETLSRQYLLGLVVAPVHTLRVRKHEPQLLKKESIRQGTISKRTAMLRMHAG